MERLTCPDCENGTCHVCHERPSEDGGQCGVCIAQNAEADASPWYAADEDVEMVSWAGVDVLEDATEREIQDNRERMQEAHDAQEG